MNYMIVYIDSYNRHAGNRTRFFDTETEMYSFASRDEVYTVVGFYKVEKI